MLSYRTATTQATQSSFKVTLHFITDKSVLLAVTKMYMDRLHTDYNVDYEHISHLIKLNIKTKQKVTQKGVTILYRICWLVFVITALRCGPSSLAQQHQRGRDTDQ